MKKYLTIVAVSGLLSFALSSQASAAVILYDDEATFLAAVEGEILESFEGLNAGDSSTTYSLADFDVFADKNMTVADAGVGGAFATDGDQYLLTNAQGNAVTFAFDDSQLHFGVNLTDAADIATPFTIDLMLDGATVATIVLPTAPNGAQDFLGLSSTTFFDSVKLSFDTGVTADGIGIDEVYYSAVPEPSSLALLGMGALSLLGYGRRRKRKASEQTT